MKNANFWYIRPSSYITGDITSPLQSSVGNCYVTFEVFPAATMKNAIFWDVSSQHAPVADYGLRSKFTHSCHPDVGGGRILRNVGSYKSHTA
jgi:hypothetical protein